MPSRGVGALTFGAASRPQMRPCVSRLQRAQTLARLSSPPRKGMRPPHSAPLRSTCLAGISGSGGQREGLAGGARKLADAAIVGFGGER